MGTSQCHNIKSGPNWKDAKRAITNISKGSGDTSQNCHTFMTGFSSAIDSGLYRGGGHRGRSGSSFGYAGSRMSTNFLNLINDIRSNGISTVIDLSKQPSDNKDFKKNFRDKVLDVIMGEHESSMDDAAAAYAMEKVLDEILADCETKQDVETKLTNASNDDLITWMINFQIEYIIEYSGEIFQSHIWDKCENPNKITKQIRDWLHTELDDRMHGDLSKYDLSTQEGKQVVDKLTSYILDIWKQE